MKTSLKNVNVDKILTVISVVYIIVPVILFLMFWTKIWIGLIGSVLIIYGAINVIKELNENDDVKIIVKKNIVPIVIIFLVVLVYILFSGIGGIGSQCSDFYVRNPMFFDLNHMEWPLVYNFAPDNKISHIFSGEYLFVYYIAYWLPVSLIVKIFNLSTGVADILLMIYVLIGMLLIMFNICKYLKCVKYVVLIFLFFSGMDIIGGFLKDIIVYFSDNGYQWEIFLDVCKYFFEKLFSIRNCLTIYNRLITYEDIMLSIYNTFNQSICVYLIFSLFIRLKSNKYVAYILSLVFAYSPWAMIGSMLYIVFANFRKKEKFVGIINVANVLVPMFMLVVFGSYFAISHTTNSDNEVLLFFHKQLLLQSVLSIIFEWLIYWLLICNKNIKYDYFIPTFINLLFFDIVYPGNGNFNMRGATPAIFFLAIYIIQFFMYTNNIKECKVSKVWLVICLCIGFVTPLFNIIYGVQSFKNHTNINNPIKSFKDPILFNSEEENDYYFKSIESLYFSNQYKDSLFYKYIMNKGGI